MSEDLAARVEQLEELVGELETTIERQQQAHEAYKEQVVKPRLEALEESRDDAQAERAELENMLYAMRERVRDLEVGIDSVIGLAEEEKGNPAKRASDLRLGMIRAAEAKPDTTVAAKHWHDVQEFFAEHGHGEVSKPLCFKAMDDAADHDGFYTKEKSMVLPSGRDGRGIFVDTEKLPNSGTVSAGNNVTTRNGGDTTKLLAETGADD